MAFKVVGSGAFEGVVYAGDIKPATCMLDYVRGTASFYIENTYYPVASAKREEADKKLYVYQNDKATGKPSQRMNAPVIFYHHGDSYYRDYQVYWGDNINTYALYTKPMSIMNPYGAIDANGKPKKTEDDGKKKIRSFGIQISSLEKFEGSSSDKALSQITFHISELHSILLYAHIFKLDLSAPQYQKITTNTDFYKTVVEDMNKYLEENGISVRIKLTKEMLDAIEKYNEPIVYAPDPDSDEEMRASIPVYEEDGVILALPTFQSMIKTFKADLRKARVDPKTFLEEPELSKFNKFSISVSVSNRFMLTKYAPKSDPINIRDIFKIKADFNVPGKACPPEKVIEWRSLFTQLSDGENHHAITEDELMALYRKRGQGHLFFKFELNLGVYIKPAYSLTATVTVINFTAVEKSSVSTSDKAFDLIRRSKVSASTAPRTVEAEDRKSDDIDIDYNDVSDDII